MGSGHLRYDFIVSLTPEVCFVLEYDGIQHFQPIEYFGGSSRFKQTWTHDRIKDGYAVSNLGCPVLRVSYRCENVECLLNVFIRDLKNRKLKCQVYCSDSVLYGFTACTQDTSELYLQKGEIQMQKPPEVIEAEAQFRKICSVKYRLDANNKIWCERKLDARPPDILIPRRVLNYKRLHDQFGGLDASMFRSKQQLYSARQWLRRFCMIPHSGYGIRKASKKRKRKINTKDKIGLKRVRRLSTKRMSTSEATQKQDVEGCKGISHLLNDTSEMGRSPSVCGVSGGCASDEGLEAKGGSGKSP